MGDQSGNAFSVVDRELVYVHSGTMKTVCSNSGRKPSKGISFVTQKLPLAFKCQLCFCFHQVGTFSNTLTKPYFSTLDRALKPRLWLIVLTRHSEQTDLVLAYIPILFHGTLIILICLCFIVLIHS